jgi:undecaprenyl-diphosphatase
VSPLAAALLGAVQGLTEFLPVSSSAHLILARAFFGWTADTDAPLGLPFEVACHLGTLAAVIVYFRADLAALVRAIPAAFSQAPGVHGRRLWLIAAGTVPILIVGGLIWSDRIEHATRTPLVAAVALLVGAVLLLAIERAGERTKGEEALTMPGALLIGVAQSAALIPGVSRSGATIAAGMALGLRRDAAARFTFLMSIPAILAAAGKQGLELRHAVFTSEDAMLFAIGISTSAVVGYLTVKYFVRFLGRHRLDVFAWYRVALAAVTFVWLAAR